MTNTYQIANAVQKAKECFEILQYLEPQHLKFAQNVLNQAIACAVEEQPKTYGETLIAKLPDQTDE